MNKEGLLKLNLTFYITLSNFLYSATCFSNLGQFPIGYNSFQEIKTNLLINKNSLKAELEKLTRDAKKYFHKKAFSIVNKTILPKGANQHDYISYAPYWWPDPSKKDGIPYIKRDGIINRELRNQGDNITFHRMANAVEILSLSYLYTQDEIYAQHAVRFLATWFLDPNTRMNPNVNFGQIIIGKKDQDHRAGIMEMRFLTNILECFKLLRTSKSFNPIIQKGIKEWISHYFQWLETSSHGKGELLRSNNHGTWYDLQYISIALFLEQKERVKKHIKQYTIPRIESQILPSGEMPLEIARSRSLHYSLYNLKAFFGIAKYAEQVNIDLWHLTKDQKGIQKALDYLLPFFLEPKKWPHKNLGDDITIFLPDILSQAYYIYKEKKYKEAYINSLQKTSSKYLSYSEKLIIPFD